MINFYFLLGIAIGVIWRFFDGKIISISVGLASGIILVELLRLLMWRIK